MGSMGVKKTKKQKKELSQAEIWDDSALVQSWDNALAEYKVYLSNYEGRIPANLLTEVP